MPFCQDCGKLYEYRSFSLDSGRCLDCSPWWRVPVAKTLDALGELGTKIAFRIWSPITTAILICVALVSWSVSFFVDEAGDDLFGKIMLSATVLASSAMSYWMLSPRCNTQNYVTTSKDKQILANFQSHWKRELRFANIVFVLLFVFICGVFLGEQGRSVWNWIAATACLIWFWLRMLVDFRKIGLENEF